MYDKNGQVIYVGKAVNLKNRVTSYFRGTHYGKTAALVENIDNLDIIVTDSELNALLTECSLIKHYNPMYNIRLKDGRGYPFIWIREENGWPMISIENHRNKRYGKYFGPYTNRQSANHVVDLIKKAFLLPSCTHKSRRPTKLCLEYHINHCRGFCEQKVSQEEVTDIINSMHSVLNGKIDNIYNSTKEEMEKAADKTDFEKAALLRDRLYALDIVKDKQKPLIPQTRNADYISYAEFQADPDNKNSKSHTCIFMLRIRNGYVVGERCDMYDEEFSSTLLGDYIERFYTSEDIPEGKIYINGDYEWISLYNTWLKNKITNPTFEQDEKLLEIARNNASERLLLLEGKTKKGQRRLAAFCEFTGIKKADVIELYDVSSIAGTHTVCGMIVCIDGNFAKQKYRKFKIQKTYGNDDTACMKEAVARRLRNFRDGNESFTPLPDLIVCDGGLGQIHAVEEVVRDFKYNIPVIGFKKDSKHKTKAITFSNGTEKVLKPYPEVFVFCGLLQEEVHRFAISYHKKLRDNFAGQSELYKIEGIGKAKAKAVFLKFKSLVKIKEATIEELTEVEGINENLAIKIKQFLEEDE